MKRMAALFAALCIAFPAASFAYTPIPIVVSDGPSDSGNTTTPAGTPTEKRKIIITDGPSQEESPAMGAVQPKIVVSDGPTRRLSTNNLDSAPTDAPQAPAEFEQVVAHPAIVTSDDGPGIPVGQAVQEPVISAPARTTLAAAPTPTNAKNAFVVYGDKGPGNHFIPSGWMGDYGDIRIDDANKENPHSGATAIKIIYSAQGRQGAGWAGIFWQTPANNWGNKPGGFDLTGKKRLIFWARGAKGGEVVSEFKMGGIAGDKGDSDSANLDTVTLTKGWKSYTIDLAGKDLSNIIGGFCWAANRDNNPDGMTFFLDDIRYE